LRAFTPPTAIISEVGHGCRAQMVTSLSGNSRPGFHSDRQHAGRVPPHQSGRHIAQGDIR
jgi:hypothetical protein